MSTLPAYWGAKHTRPQRLRILALGSTGPMGWVRRLLRRNREQPHQSESLRREVLNGLPFSDVSIGLAVIFHVFKFNSYLLDVTYKQRFLASRYLEILFA